MKDQHGNELNYEPPEWIIVSTTIGKKLSPENEAILTDVRRRSVEKTLARSAERRARWGLPPLQS